MVQDVVSCAYLELLEEEDRWDASREVRSETKPIDFLLFFRVKSDSLNKAPDMLWRNITLISLEHAIFTLILQGREGLSIYLSFTNGTKRILQASPPLRLD
jgi:hypothetical protein